MEKPSSLRRLAVAEVLQFITGAESPLEKSQLHSRIAALGRMFEREIQGFPARQKLAKWVGTGGHS
jgi:hypothetical protein